MKLINEIFRQKRFLGLFENIFSMALLWMALDMRMTLDICKRETIFRVALLPLFLLRHFPELSYDPPPSVGFLTFLLKGKGSVSHIRRHTVIEQICMAMSVLAECKEQRGIIIGSEVVGPGFVHVGRGGA